MEVQTNKALSPMQSFRYELLQWCGNVEDAKKANSFVMGNENPEQAQLPKPEWKHGEAQMPSEDIPDGVYIVQADGQIVLFVDDLTADT